MDNFEWAAGYDLRYGITYVDFETQQRVIKDSGLFYRQWIEKQLAFREVHHDTGAMHRQFIAAHRSCFAWKRRCALRAAPYGDG
jgi:hypothetical protein